MKRLLLGVLVLVVLAIGTLAAIVVPAFSGAMPIPESADLPGVSGVRQVKDQAGSFFVLPAGEGAVVLIDCGMENGAAGVMTELSRRGLKADAVKAILVTHGHPDHVGGCVAFPQAQLMVLEADVPYATGAVHPKGPATRLLPFKGQYPQKVTRVLHDGETVQVGPLSARVYAAPGHTPGSAAFLIDRVLYLGDLAVGKADGKTIKDAPWFFSDDPEQNRASTRSLARRLQSEKADVQTLAFSHSGPLTGLAPLASGTP